jgi:hypothetical protein
MAHMIKRDEQYWNAADGEFVFSQRQATRFESKPVDAMGLPALMPGARYVKLKTKAQQPKVQPAS